jgi:hypothetical protein
LAAVESEAAFEGAGADEAVDAADDFAADPDGAPPAPPVAADPLSACVAADPDDVPERGSDVDEAVFSSPPPPASVSPPKILGKEIWLNRLRIRSAAGVIWLAIPWLKTSAHNFAWLAVKSSLIPFWMSSS